ncbi:hypothetical protein C8R44DRAFT_882545 [Mycena epipterygia]|nr:hypothetical protein C8R44DRAFT_882545 [Mycena epipterygia]
MQSTCGLSMWVPHAWIFAPSVSDEDGVDSPPNSGSPRESSDHHGGNGVNVNVKVHVKREPLYDPELNIQAETELNQAEISIIAKSGEEEGVPKPRVLDIVPLYGILVGHRVPHLNCIAGQLTADATTAHGRL